MASFLRVSRGFARAAARQVAAPVARLGSGGAAAPSDLPRSRRLSFLRGGSAVDAPPLGRAMSSHTDAPSPSAADFSGFAEDLDIVSIEPFEADEKDLESDEALWALYERWCEHFNEKRDHDEMVRYFPIFKETALSVDRVKKANLPYELGFNQFADGKLRELCSYRYGDFNKDAVAYFDEDVPYSESMMFANAKGTVFEEDESNDGHPKGTGHVSNRA